MIRSPQLVGAALVVLAAFLLAGTSTSAVLAYRGGGNPAIVMLVRFCGGVAILLALLGASRTGVRLPSGARWAALAVGVPQAAQAYFLYQAFANIPVGLTMIIFYVYPLLVALIAGAMGHDRMTRSLGLGLGIALIGLVLVFDVSDGRLNLEGALNALGAALSWALVVVLSGRIARGLDSRKVTLHVQTAALILTLAAVAAGMELHLPTTSGGWGALLLLPLFYGSAMAIFFIAVSMIGPMRASLIMNVEALFAVVLGYAVLSQSLTPPQLAGGALVVLALFTARRKTEN